MTAYQLLEKIGEAADMYFCCFEGVYVLVCGADTEARELLLDAVSFAIDIAADQQPDKDGKRRFRCGSPV